MKQFTKYICVFLMMAGMSVSAWGETITITYDYNSDYNDMWDGDMDDASTYWKITGTATFSIPIAIQPTSNITISIKMAYAGTGTEGLEKISASGTETSSNWTMGETSACSHSGSDYSTCNFTITKNATPTTLEGLDITLDRKYGKNLRVQKIQVSYTSADVPTIVLTRSGSPVTYIDFGTITSAGTDEWTFDLSSFCTGMDSYDYCYYYLTLDDDAVFYESDDDDYYGYIFSDETQFKIGYVVESPGTYEATLNIEAYKTKSCGGNYDGEAFSIDIPITITYSSSCSTSPTVTEGSNSSVTSTTATISCSSGISSLGSAGCSISSYGFVMNTTGTPTTDDTKHQVGTTYTTTDVAFSKDLTGLTPNTTYYVRPYATNGNGTAYGTQTSFTTLQRYAITYYKNDGGATSDVEYKDHGVDYTISSNKYSRDHYTLSKWHTKADGTTGTDYAKGASYTSNAVLNLYAVWQINTHSLHWYKNADDADDLTGSYTDGNAIAYGATVTAPNTPTRTGYTFAGWSETSSGSTTTPVTSMPDADKSYYAIWIAHTYSVHFDANHDDAEGSMDDQDFTYGVAQALTTCGFTNEGYFFKGWATSDDGDVVYTNGQSVSNLSSTDEDVVDLFAVWGTYEKYVFACAEISVDLEDSKKVLVTSRNGVNIMAVNKLLVTTEGAVDGHTVDISSDAGLKFYKKVDGVYKDLSVVANKLVTPLTDQEVYVSYNPTSDGTGAITTPEFTISCEGFTQTFNTSGEYIKVRNLPAAVAIVAKVGSTYHALTGNITSSTTPEDIMISASTVDGVLKANGPADLAYKLWPVKTTNGTADRFGTYSSPAASYGDRIRLAGKSDKGLMANNNASSNKYNINNSATIDATDDDGAAPYEWKITTTESDGQFVYTLQTDQTNNTRKLRMYNGRWGTYLDEKGVEELYLLPLVTTTQADMEAYEWGLNELVVKYSPAATPVALTSIKAAATEITASETTKITRIGSSDLWKIQGLSDLSMGSKPAEQLIISVTENGAAKQALIQIPFLVSDAKTDQDLRLSVSNVAKVYQNTDVVILQTGKLTNQYAAGVFNDLYIYPGGKLIADANKMTVSRLYMRGGYSYIGDPRWNVPRAKIGAGLVMDVDTIIYDLNMNAEQYYDLAVPYAVKLEEATDDEGFEDFNVWLQIYDGNNRANNGKGWTWFNWAVATPTLQPGVGYLIEALPRYGRTYCTVRFPMKADLSEGEGDKTPVAVTAHGLIDGNIMNGKTPNNVGWNFCANPYLCDFGIGEDAEHFEESPEGVLQIGELALGEDGKYKWDTEGAKNVRYVTTFDFESQHYEQYPLEDVTLAPFTGFFIQVGKTGTLNFANEGRQLSAPALRNNSMPRDMEIAIQLTGNGQADEARLHINDDLTISDPLEFPDENTKQINANYVNLYSYSDSVSMYANGMSYDESENWNDMGVVAPNEGNYTFSIKKVNRNYVNGVLILDKTTSVAYNLLDGDVTLQLPAGTINERFAVKIQYGPATTTDFEGNGEAEHTNPEKFIYDDKMFIRCKGVLYDATGKKVGEVRKAQ